MAKKMETGKMLSFEDLPPESLKTETNTSNMSTDSKPTSEKNISNGEETMPKKLFYSEHLSKEESENLPPESQKTETNISNMSADSKPTSEKISQTVKKQCLKNHSTVNICLRKKVKICLLNLQKLKPIPQPCH